MGEHSEQRPLVLLLHGFPEYWWAWRHHIASIAKAGFEVAAVDLRGAGGSDKTPDIVDVPTLAQDILAISRSLGARSTILVGLGRGGSLAWTAAGIAPSQISALLTFSAPHPKALRFAATRTNMRLLGDIAATYVRPLARKGLGDSHHIERLLSSWSAPGNTGASSQAELYSAALRLPHAANSAIEQLRWSYMTLRHVSGFHYARIVRQKLDIPVWTVRGELDPLLGVSSWKSDEAHTEGEYRHIIVKDAGHFIVEENPKISQEIILEFLTPFL